MKDMGMAKHGRIAAMAAVALLGAAFAAEWFAEPVPRLAEPLLQSGWTAPATVSATAVASSPLVVGPLRFGEWSYAGPNGNGAPAIALGFDPSVGTVVAGSPQGWIYTAQYGGQSWTASFALRPADPIRAPGAPFRQIEFVAGQDGVRTVFAVQADGYLVQATGQDGAYVNSSMTQRVNRLRAVGSRLFALTEFGAWFTSDGGRTWSTYNDLPSGNCYDAAASDRHIVLLCENGRMYLSAAPYGSRIVEVPGYKYFDRGGRLAVARSNPRVLYAAFPAPAYEGGSGAYVYRSVDGGSSWASMASPAGANLFHRHLLGDFDRECGRQPVSGADAFVFEVDPGNSDTVWIGARELYRSDDGGAQFFRASNDDAPDGQSGRLPAKVHALYFQSAAPDEGTGRLLAATSKGIHEANNPAGSVQVIAPDSCTVDDSPLIEWMDRNSGFDAHVISAVAIDSEGWVLATLNREDEGALYAGVVRPLDFETPNGPWERISNATPTVIRLDPVKSIDLFYTNHCGSSSKSCRWAWDAPNVDWSVTPTAGLDHGAVDAASVIVPDPRDPQRFWSVHGTQPYRSDDGLISASPAGWGIQSPITAGAVSPVDSGIVMFGTQQGEIHWRHNALVDNPGWNRYTLDGMGGTVTGLVFDPLQPARVYATVASPGRMTAPLWISTDAGQNWRSLPFPGLDGTPYRRQAHSLAMDPFDTGMLYVGTEDGVYVTLDAGKSGWTRLDAPFPRTAVRKLVLKVGADNSRLLYAFTEGRGVWRMRIDMQRYVDVPFDHWAHTWIERMALAGITGGCATAPARYCPDQPVTRDQMAVFLLRAMYGSNFKPLPAQGAFADVPTVHWAAPWIEGLRHAGVTSGCATDPLRYCPDSRVTRDQMAVFLLRARFGRHFTPPPAEGRFVDVPREHWAAAWIEQLAREGITGGCSTSPAMYCPDAPVTRDQMAVLLTRAYGL